MSLKFFIQNSHSRFQILNSRFPLFFLLFVFYFLFSGSARGAVLYLDPSSGQYYQSDTFIANIKVDAQDECINAVYLNLNFSKDILEAKDFAIGNSIISVWLKEPELSNEKGIISFSGGIPGGYCGRIIGDPGQSNLLGRIIFRVKDNVPPQRDVLPGVEFLDTSQVLLNDGFGTKAELKTQGAVFAILPGVPEVPRIEWQKELGEDKTPPEPFIIEVNKDPNLFGGKYFLTFQAQDKQTGLDYYEIQEGSLGWIEAKSPYLLKDQRLKSLIQLKAIDKAGNSRIVEYSPIVGKARFPWVFFSIGAALLLIIFIIYVRKNIARSN